MPDKGVDGRTVGDCAHWQKTALPPGQPGSVFEEVRPHVQLKTPMGNHTGEA